MPMISRPSALLQEIEEDFPGIWGRVDAAAKRNSAQPGILRLSSEGMSLASKLLPLGQTHPRALPLSTYKFADETPPIPNLWQPELVTFMSDRAMMVAGFEEIEGQRYYQGWWIRWVDT